MSTAARLSFLLSLLAPLSSPAHEPLEISEHIYLSTTIDQPAEGCEPNREAEDRVVAVSKVAFADPVDLTGHIEAVLEDGELSILGRRVRTQLATLEGGDRASLRPATLVRVIGTGTASGSIEAEKLEIIHDIEPDVAARLDRELEKFKKKYWEKAERLEDPELLGYLQGIVNQLAPSYVPGGDRKFEIIVVKNPDLNAFALPDGTIVLHTGIIARMNNEAQLACIVGHELAHVTQRHALRSIRKETQHKVIGWGSLLAAVALGVSGNGDAAQGVQLMSSAWLSGYSRAHEDEADQVGLRYLYLAGYDVREASSVWSTFRLLYGDQSSEANFFYGSHSTARDREHNLRHEVWKAYEPSGLVGGRVDQEEFLRLTAPVLRENALLDLKAGRIGWAEWGLSKSLAIAPNDPATYVALAKLDLKRGGARAALSAADTLRHALTIDPQYPPAHRDLGFVLEQLGDPKGARAELERYLELDPEASDAGDVRRRLGTG